MAQTSPSRIGLTEEGRSRKVRRQTADSSKKKLVVSRTTSVSVMLPLITVTEKQSHFKFYTFFKLQSYSKVFLVCFTKLCKMC